jgi:GTP 3',8-cyclase
LKNYLASCRVFNSSNETALKELIRFGSTDEHIIDTLNQAVLSKEPGHKINPDDFERPTRVMQAIGD